MQEQSNQSATEAPNSCGPSAYEEVVGQPSRQSDAVEQNVTVASLLSQLSSSESPYRHDAQHNSTSDEPASVTSLSRQGDSVGVLPRVHRTQNIREMSFQQSLPLLARQSEDLSFAETITKVSLYIVQLTACHNFFLELREEQDNMESQLWEERQHICINQADKVKTALTKRVSYVLLVSLSIKSSYRANVLGSNISAHESEVSDLPGRVGYTFCVVI